MQNFCETNVFEQFYLKNARSLRNYLCAKCGDSARAQDLMQESFLKIWKKCAEIVGETAVGLLFRVATQLFLDEEKHQKVHLKFESNVLRQTPQNAHSPAFILEEKEFDARLQQAICALSEAQRTVFLMNRIEKMTYAEIAERLDLSVKAIEKRMHGALLSLRDDLKMKI